jgi:hypothetical protein
MDLWIKNKVTFLRVLKSIFSKYDFFLFDKFIVSLFIKMYLVLVLVLSVGVLVIMYVHTCAHVCVVCVCVSVALLQTHCRVSK